jgi:hypothetical protein
MPAETDEQLRAEADRLLASGLRALLAAYGEVHVVGSYALRLMAWRDLDLHVVRDDLDRRSFFDLGARVADLLAPPRMHFRDDTAGTPGLPAGLYWGVYLGDERAGAWKVDIWATGRAEFDRVRAHADAVAARLTEPARRAILRIKAACWQDPGYRRRFSATDIYTAVLDRGVTDPAEFRAHLAAASSAAAEPGAAGGRPVWRE